MRNCKLILAATILAAALLSYTPAKAQGTPPQEAMTACENHSSGDSCTILSPRGEVSGTCNTKGNQIICIPEGFMNKDQGGPPQEALTACENHSSGEPCTIASPRGDVSGTCDTLKGDQLICVPEGFENKNPDAPSEEALKRGPPQAAITACEGQPAGAACTVTMPNEIMSGICDNLEGGYFACVPEKFMSREQSIE